MKKHSLTLLAILALSGTALADLRETQTFPGPYGIFGYENFRNTTLSANFTGIDNGTPYEARAVMVVMDLESVVPVTWAYDIVVEITPPTGPALLAYPSNEFEYTTIDDAFVEVLLPAAVNPVGEWSILIFDQFEDDGGTPDSRATNVSVSLEDLPPLPLPSPLTELGVLTQAGATATIADYSGADVQWFKVTLSQPVNNASGYYVDMNTVSTMIGPSHSEQPNDTVMGLFDSYGVLYAANDDIAYPDSPESYLTFGADAARSHGDLATYDGSSGDLYVGDYYIAAAAYSLYFQDGFVANLNSISSGGSLVVNVFSNIPGGPASCSPADIGSTGGAEGSDNRLDNNDFIVFIDRFFDQAASADIGGTGGAPGSDGVFDNNDFIVFIDQFFDDQANCTG